MSQEGSFALSTTSDSGNFFDSTGAGGVAVLYVRADVDFLLQIAGLHSDFVPLPANTPMPFSRQGMPIQTAKAKVASGTGTLWFGPLKA